jgi:hexosaminidase
MLHRPSARVVFTLFALCALTSRAVEPDLIPRPAVLEVGPARCTPSAPPREIVDPTQPPEGYVLDLTPTALTVRAAGPAGFFRARQTLEQLGPAPWPALHIEDAPRFGWRGLMLDASRHFQTVEEVKRLLDRMARYKLNVLHWHLTDGHGWRIEIKQYPKLTAVGGFREQPPVGRYGGFYTQAEIRDVVAYAAARHITVVPEIEMPGHSRAAVAAYPELGCPQAPQPVDYFFDFPCPAQRFPAVPGTDVLCVSREATFTFLTNVLAEVMDLFPAPFIHVGGDEVNFASWDGCTNCQARRRELGLKNGHAQQSWFMQRVDQFLTSHGRRLIGWDEILEGGLASNATVMSWRGTAGGVAAAKSGHDAVMSPRQPALLRSRPVRPSQRTRALAGHRDAGRGLRL